MTVERQLAARVLQHHPQDASRVLERLGTNAAVLLLSDVATGEAAAVLAAMAPDAARALLTALPVERASAIVEQLDTAVAALLLRGLLAENRDAILARLPAPAARALGRVLEHAEDTAGAVMDPTVLALPDDLTAGEAIDRVREAASAARYNLYLVDRAQRLTGVINQRELLLAPAGSVIATFMKRRVQRLPANADTNAIVTHPAWRTVHSMPVVDGEGRYVGAIRYRTFRALEDSLRERRADPNVTADALGDLFRTSASALFQMLSVPDHSEAGRRADDR